jgi:Kdo2-lipid IVA lauroyltransferase/acyltransferase
MVSNQCLSMIKKAAYAILTALLWLLALLPLELLYFLAKIIYFVTYYILRYRRSTVFENLERSFPQKTVAERKKIEKQYFRNLANLVVEFIKMRHIRPESINKRMQLVNPEMLESLYMQKKSLFVAIGHCGNWEWLGHKLAHLHLHKPFAAVKPLSDPNFDAYMRSIRMRFGVPELIPFKKTYRTLLNNKQTTNAVVLASDQTPTRKEINYWTIFLNQETPFFLGIGKMASALDYAVLFFDIRRKSRGYYEIEIKPVTLNPSELSPQEITEKYVNLLEEAIVRQPDNWLWSHRRWKHKKQPS